MTGYLHPGYAESLAQFGNPRELPQCRGWILERQIPGSTDHDAIGCYPRFFCQNWALLQDDLDEIGSELISIAVTTDPFGAYDIAQLNRCFKDVIIPFKEHFIVDLNCSLDDIISRNQRKKVRKAFKSLSVEICQEPTQFVEEWVALYDRLIGKYKIKGIRAFSKKAFARQLSIPGIVMFRAVYQGITVGATLWFVMGEVGYGHLAAFNDTGYNLMASYALDWYSIEYFADRVRWLDFGAGAGITKNGGWDGLSLYKRRWSTGTRTAYFCGRIFDYEKYAEILKKKDVLPTNYFPDYRKDEFQ